jgi:signal transduction histidine kinase
LTFTINSGNYKPVILYTDTDSLERILRELLKNAGKFSQENTTIFLTITPDEHKITITVTNTGDQISTEEQASIFDTFRRGKDVTKGSNQGTGLGLALVKSLVQYLSGTITVSSYPEANSNHYLNCFTITFPLGKNAQV